MLDKTRLVEDHQIEGTFAMFGNNDRDIDQIATAAVGARRREASMRRQGVPDIETSVGIEV